jgi:hypothetical protein
VKSSWYGVVRLKVGVKRLEFRDDEGIGLWV